MGGGYTPWCHPAPPPGGGCFKIVKKKKYSNQIKDLRRCVQSNRVRVALGGGGCPPPPSTTRMGIYRTRDKGGAWAHCVEAIHSGAPGGVRLDSPPATYQTPRFLPRG